MRREAAAARRAVDLQEGVLHQVLRCRPVVGQLIGNPQQLVTGMRDQLRQRVIKIHATTSGLPR